MANYGDPEYWDDRYEKAGGSASFDWLESYFSLKTLIERFCPDKEARILVLGCGNAEFSEDMYDDGYHNIVNVDISDVVIKQMKARNMEQRPLMTWITLDVTQMEDNIKSNTFDFVVDKSTLDALLCGDDSFLKMAQMLKETQRVLKTNGNYFAISYGKPESRSFHFDQPFLSFENREFILYDQNCQTEEEKSEKSHYIYVSQKREDADQMSAEMWGPCLEQLQIDAEIQRKQDELDQAAKDSESGDEQASVEDDDPDSATAKDTIQRPSGVSQTDGGAAQSNDEQEIKLEEEEVKEDGARDQSPTSKSKRANECKPASQPTALHANSASGTAEVEHEKKVLNSDNSQEK